MSQKRDQLIQASIRLFAQEGVGVATAKIAKEADVSNGTLFNHFATKQELIDSVYLHIKTIMADDVLTHLDMNQPLHDLFLEVWRSYAMWCHKNTLEKIALDLLKSSQLLTEKAKEEAHEGWEKIAKKITAGLEQRILVEVPKEIIFLTSEGMLNSIMDYAKTNKLSLKDLDTTVAQGFGIFWRGISTEYNIKETVK